jgi:hypothetical protein
MLTEAEKQKIKTLEKLAKERDLAFEIVAFPDNLSRYLYFFISKGRDRLLNFKTVTLTDGLNRLMREIKAYPVVE